MSRDVDLALMVDGASRPLVLGRADLHPTADALRFTVPLALDDTVVDAAMDLRVDPARDVLTLALTAPPSFGESGHTLALRADLGSEGQVVFAAGVGQIADRATVKSSALVVDADPHPMAFLSAAGPLTVDATPDDALMPIQPMRLSATSPTVSGGDTTPADLRLVVADSSATLWTTLAEIVGVPTAIVRGHVTGTVESALVFGRDAQGNPQVRARAGPGGAFVLSVPTSVVEWYAAVDPGRASSLVSFVPGTARDLLLDISPGGDLHVSITDADTQAALTARLLVHGIDGTLDPSFGPDYRASGAGPVIDALRGEVTTPLPSGRYRVAATKGIEWSIDAKVIDIAPGRLTRVELAPRHVVPTPGILGCDLHVHARPSFDTPVTPEDRVLSLVAAGIEFAVPTEHNVVGDYASSLETLDLGGELLSVPGVEVTTYSKGFGHFGVFPYPPTSPVPPFKHTNMASIFRAVRAGDPNRYFQLNHPRLPKGLGYFNNLGFDPKAPRAHVHQSRRLRRNRSLQLATTPELPGSRRAGPARLLGPPRLRLALHRNGQQRFASDPVSLGRLSSDARHRESGRHCGNGRVNASMRSPSSPTSRKAHATVTTGPVIEPEVGGARVRATSSLRKTTRSTCTSASARPPADVTHVDLVAGEIGKSYRIVESFDIPSRPTAIGTEAGTIEEAQEKDDSLRPRLLMSPLGAGQWLAPGRRPRRARRMG